MGCNELNYLRGYLIGKNCLIAAKALNIAERCHKGQVRKATGEPYVYHPVQVASLLASIGVEDDETLAAAILHDVLEDCRITEIELEDESIPRSVLRTVQFVTKDKFFEKIPEEYEKYYSEILTDPKACLVKVADRCHNLATMAHAFNKEKRSVYIKETKTYIIPLIRKARWMYPEIASKLYALKFFIDGICNLVDEETSSMGD